MDLSHVVGGPDGGVFVGDMFGKVGGEVKAGDEGIVVVGIFG